MYPAVSQHSSGPPLAPAGSAGSYYPTVGQVSTGRPLAGENGPSAYGGSAAAAPASSGSPMQTFPLLRVQIAELYRTLPPARTRCLSPCCLSLGQPSLLVCSRVRIPSIYRHRLSAARNILLFLRCATVQGAAPVSSRCLTVKLLLWLRACANAVGALQVLITPNLADQVPRQQFAFDFELERSLVASDQRREAGDSAERSDAGTGSLVSTPDHPTLCAR